MKFQTNMIAFQTILRKEVVRILRIWQQTILPSGITMSLYLIIFGGFIGSQVDKVQGFTYMQFIIPGIIMMSVIMNSYSNVVSSFFGAKFQTSIEEILVSPASRFTIISGYCAGGIFRGLMVGLLVSVISYFFAELTIHNLTVLILFIILTSVLFTLLGMLNAIFAKRFDDVQIIPTFVLTPLTYLGGVFYSIELLPSFWQIVSKFNPILYMVNGFRFGFLGFSDVNIGIGFTILVVFTLALFITDMELLRRGVGLKE